MIGTAVRLMLKSALILLLAFIALPAQAEPAMWVVKDADSTLYLFGTFHLVRPETQWRTEKVAKAIESSSEIWIEASEGDDPAMIQTLVMRHGIDPQHPLSTKIDAATKEKLDKAARAAGLTLKMLEPMRPWMAALAITVVPVVKAGYDPSKGVDKMLEAEAKATQKALKTFETPEQQVLFFANLPPEVELSFLTQAIEESEEAPAVVDQMAKAWVDGDIEALDRLTFEQMKETTPELYDQLIVQRNRTWADTIAQMMAGSGTIFIGVGAGHMTGASSLPALLTERGFTVERY